MKFIVIVHEKKKTESSDERESILYEIYEVSPKIYQTLSLLKTKLSYVKFCVGTNKSLHGRNCTSILYLFQIYSLVNQKISFTLFENVKKISFLFFFFV